MTCVLIRRGRDPSLHRGMTIWSGKKRAAICKPRKEASGETDPAGTLILDFQPPELWEKKFCSLGYPVCVILLQQPQKTNRPGPSLPYWRHSGPRWKRSQKELCRVPCIVGVFKLWNISSLLPRGLYYLLDSFKGILLHWPWVLFMTVTLS